MLRLSKSAAFAQDHAIDTSDDAINRVGFREVFKLVGMEAASDFFSSRNNTYRIDSSTMWENAFSCGLAMESIAQKIEHYEQEYSTLASFAPWVKPSSISVPKRNQNLAAIQSLSAL